MNKELERRSFGEMWTGRGRHLSRFMLLFCSILLAKKNGSMNRSIVYVSYCRCVRETTRKSRDDTWTHGACAVRRTSVSGLATSTRETFDG